MKRDRLEALGEHIAAQQEQLLARIPGSETTRRKLAERVALRAESRSARPWVMSYWRLWVPMAALAAVALALFGARGVLFPALEFRVGQAEQPGVLRDWVNATSTERLPIQFSDGTRVELEPDARARVVAVSRAGAEVVLEAGRAHFDVEKAKRLPGEQAWKVDVGPFVVEVKGTTFDVGWDPRQEQFALDLLEGAVTVRGCGRDAPVDVVAGQGIRASCKDGSWIFAPVAELAALTGQPRVADAEGDASLAQGPVGAPRGSAPIPAAPIPTQSAATDRTETHRPEAVVRAPAMVPTVSAAAAGWRDVARAGHHAKAFELASAAGFDAECERSGAPDVLLLGDIARLSGHSERAIQAYGAVRKRFGGTTSAARAAFALGRSSVGSDRGAAERWFETYLSEEPRGPFAQAASDWLFELAVKNGNPERLRARARSYLDSSPNGPHAADARRVLEHVPEQP